MQHIKTDFGFKTISIGSITIYTGKIRIKTPIGFLQHKLQNHLEHITITERLCTKHYRYYSTITFETTSALLNNQLIDAINELLRQMMHARIDAKYSRRTAYEPNDYLPY
jgi:imidazoleglycerol phosphate dehydratase HisB